MAAAGLTHGGFYRHFDSKEQLVAEALTVSIHELLASNSDTASGEVRMREMVAAYLSKHHRDNPASGCPIAAIGSEIARCGNNVRKVATEGFKNFVNIFAGRSGGDAQSDYEKQQALVDSCTLIGALTVARIVTDSDLSEEILQHVESHLVRHEQQEPTT